jgi:hypothetical protein
MAIYASASPPLAYDKGYKISMHANPIINELQSSKTVQGTMKNFKNIRSLFFVDVMLCYGVINAMTSCM